MSVTEGMRRVCVAIRALGIVWFVGFSTATVIGIFSAVRQQHKADEIIAEALRQATDSQLLARVADAAQGSAHFGPQHWYEQEAASMAFTCFGFGVAGLAGTLTIAWILGGFSRPSDR